MKGGTINKSKFKRLMPLLMYHIVDRLF